MKKYYCIILSIAILLSTTIVAYANSSNEFIDECDNINKQNVSYIKLNSSFTKNSNDKITTLMSTTNNNSSITYNVNGAKNIKISLFNTISLSVFGQNNQYTLFPSENSNMYKNCTSYITLGKNIIANINGKTNNFGFCPQNFNFQFSPCKDIEKKDILGYFGINVYTSIDGKTFHFIQRDNIDSKVINLQCSTMAIDDLFYTISPETNYIKIQCNTIEDFPMFINNVTITGDNLSFGKQISPIPTPKEDTNDIQISNEHNSKSKHKHKGRSHSYGIYIEKSVEKITTNDSKKQKKQSIPKKAKPAKSKINKKQDENKTKTKKVEKGQPIEEYVVEENRIPLTSNDIPQQNSENDEPNFMNFMSIISMTGASIIGIINLAVKKI